MISPSEVFKLCGVSPKPHVEPPKFCPPVPATCGPMPLEDADFLARLVAALSPRQVFEFGTNWGVSTAVIALNTPAESCISTLDVCREMFSEEHLKADPELQMILKREHTGWHFSQVPELAGKVTQIFADSLTFDMANHQACQQFYDFILVDACHQYDFVKRDTENALKRLKPGGCLLWHDFYYDASSWHDVYRCVSEFARTHERVHYIQGTHFAFWKSGARD